MTRNVGVDIIARDKASRTFNTVAASSERSSRRIAAAGSFASRSFGRSMKVMSGIALGAAAVTATGIAAVFKTGFGEVKDASAGTAQLVAGIKSTGNAAQVSVKHLNGLAGSIQNYSGQTDDSIVAAEKLLLTFTNIRNSKTDKIFDQATTAAADMAARMGGDAASNAIRLGKALNDPVKGLSALSKVGVSFTEQQKKQVAAMVKAGDTVGAQKIILAELNKEFGGSAKAAGQSLPGQLARAKRSFEDVSQSVVTATLPAITKLLGLVTKYAIPGIGKLFAAFKSGKVTSDGFAGHMERVGKAARTVAGWFQRAWPTIKKIVVATMTGADIAIKATVDFIKQRVIPAVKTAVGWVAAHWPQIAHAFTVVWANIKPVVMAWVGLMKTIWDSVLKPFVGWVRDHWPIIKAVMIGVFGAVVIAAKIALVGLKFVFDGIAFGIRTVSRVGRTLGDGLAWAYNNVISPTVGLFKTAFHDIKVGWDGMWKGMGKIGGAVLGGINKVVGLVLGAVHIGVDLLNGVIDGINGVSGALSSLWTWTGIPGIPKIPNIPWGGGGTGDIGKVLAGKGGGGAVSGKVPGLPAGFARGGPVRKGVPIIVGERRAEMFVPDQNGRIEPNVRKDYYGKGQGEIHIHLETNGQIEPAVAIAVGMRAAANRLR